MSDTPDIRDLVGDAVSEDERQELARVDRLLRSVDAPPSVSATLWPRVVRQARRDRPRPHRRRRYRALALAAALGAAAFVVGFLVRGGGELSTPPIVDRVTLAATDRAPAAAWMEIAVLPIDSAGNWPLLADVSGLPPLEADEHYELWLTQEGETTASCGRFLVDEEGNAQEVWLNAPYRFKEFDDWVVVRRGADDQRSRILLTGPVAAPV